MIFINPDRLTLSELVRTEMELLSKELIKKAPEERRVFIEAKRNETWGHQDVVATLRNYAGNKCWYSEVALDGADLNVDHFRPKGQVREVDENLQNTGEVHEGYWWLAFEFANYRLASMHANQRRVDRNTQGGKWDYFPVRGNRARSETPWAEIIEDILALDPCSQSDVALLWFDPDGNPCPSDWKRIPNANDKERVKATIWLYHLNKQEVATSRVAHIQEIRSDLRKAHAEFRLWDRDSDRPNLQAKRSFDQKIAEIKAKLAADAIFAGAKRCAVRVAIVDFPWIEEFLLV